MPTRFNVWGLFGALVGTDTAAVLFPAAPLEGVNVTPTVQKLVFAAHWDKSTVKSAALGPETVAVPVIKAPSDWKGVENEVVRKALCLALELVLGSTPLNVRVEGTKDALSPIPVLPLSEIRCGAFGASS
jgi:hypothetical protein